jgi:hypothetical protein
MQELSETWLPDHDKLLIGGSTTKWKGTGGDPSLGQVRRQGVPSGAVSVLGSDHRAIHRCKL